ncbi:DUF1707 SHOCT-like domain-containing protein [Dietzia cercidiphylli]|uniref:DUF1707 SHOCT-like domain-containing protein n=1 Tax=Dietzia cercidiphylli TaxID=498199 RepID=UPI00223B83DA|nr:DUF1707 domain-containing protein [Dietzia cercidiphylli]MCT1514898.1 DUF1707 domain-containing protein [Dietzia cercidiphylli]
MDDARSDPDRDLPSIRASDHEREATARFLQQSFSEGRLTLAEFDERTTKAYGARFQSDLAELTRDLSPARRDVRSAPAVHHDAAPARRITGGGGPSTSLAVMGGCERRGTWTVPAEHTAFALMGGVELDLREAALQAHETTIRAFAIMGGVEILVPDDIHVEVEGLGLMGGFSEASGKWKPDPRPVRQPPAGAPVVRITGLALMGGVDVRRVPRTR